MTKPQAFRVSIPTEKFGELYEGIWVERRIQVGRSLWHRFRDTVKGDYLDDDKALEDACEVLADCYTGWNIEDLSEPWGNPSAFKELADLDLNLFFWVVGNAVLPMDSVLETEKN